MATSSATSIDGFNRLPFSILTAIAIHIPYEMKHVNQHCHKLIKQPEFFKEYFRCLSRLLNQENLNDLISRVTPIPLKDQELLEKMIQDLYRRRLDIAEGKAYLANFDTRGIISPYSFAKIAKDTQQNEDLNLYNFVIGYRKMRIMVEKTVEMANEFAPGENIATNLDKITIFARTCRQVINTYSKNEQSFELINGRFTTIPKELCTFSKIRNLSFGNNRLESIPNEIVNLNSLMFLNLSYNKIRTIPDCIDNLPNLVWLNLNNNLITDIPLQSIWFKKERTTEETPTIEINLINNPLTGPFPYRLVQAKYVLKIDDLIFNDQFKNYRYLSMDSSTPNNTPKNYCIVC